MRSSHNSQNSQKSIAGVAYEFSGVSVAIASAGYCGYWKAETL